MTHSQTFMGQVAQVAAAIDAAVMERIVAGLVELRDKGGRPLGRWR